MDVTPSGSRCEIVTSLVSPKGRADSATLKFYLLDINNRDETLHEFEKNLSPSLLMSASLYDYTNSKTSMKAAPA